MTLGTHDLSPVLSLKLKNFLIRPHRLFNKLQVYKSFFVCKFMWKTKTSPLWTRANQVSASCAVEIGSNRININSNAVW